MELTPFQRKIRSLTRAKYLPYFIKGLPPQLDKDILTDTVNKYRETLDRDEKIKLRNKIIESHLRLGVSIAARFASTSRFRAEDIIGEMFLALIEGVIKAKVKLIDNEITPYLISHIHSRLDEYIKEDKTVYVPARTVRYFITKGSRKLDRLPKNVGLIVDREFRNDGLTENIKQTINRYSITPQVIESKTVAEMLEVLDKVTPDFIDKKIIELRIQGLTFKEIGPLVGYSEASICIRVKSIEQRFNKKYHG